MTYPIDANLQDRFAESIMQSILEVAPKLMKDQKNYKNAANFMWNCTMALNGLIQKGVPNDWAIHVMGHELTALYGIDHARTLAILTESHYRYNVDSKKDKLVQYAERVWGILDGNDSEKAEKAIEKTTEFFHSIGIKTKLSEYTSEFEGAAKEIETRFESRGMTGIGERGTLTPQDVKKIVEMSY